MSTLSIHENGGKGVVVSVETSLSNGLPNMILVGFAGKSLDESRERIRSAFANSKIPLPKKRITVNVSPSDIPKDGSHYDLAIAISILKASKIISSDLSEDTIILGELGLDGKVKAVRGMLGKIISALNQGYTSFIIPKENINQANLLKNIKMFPVNSLSEVVEKLSARPNESFYEATNVLKEESNTIEYVDFNEVIGQLKAKRALEIAAAGGHNVLLNGPPGVGKSMLAKALPGIMSKPTHSEIISVTHLHSLAGDNVVDLVQTRPFRSPHHSSSDVSIIGGGQRPKPGEVSLAHCGVLFLDELPEFRRSTIEALRQPLEDGVVTVSRAKDTVTYPASFMLVATKNPCPCGFYGSTKPCTCSAIELDRYQKKLSGPIMDRIDVHVTVDNVEHNKLLSNQTDQESSKDIRLRVEKAQELQRLRYKSDKLNSQLNNKDIKTKLKIAPDAKELLDTASDKLDISARVYMKIIKLAQTIADLEASDGIKKVHIAEALQYRPLSSK